MGGREERRPEDERCLSEGWIEIAMRLEERGDGEGKRQVLTMAIFQDLTKL